LSFYDGAASPTEDGSTPIDEKVTVYLRQKRYPFKALSKKETILVSGSCTTVSLSTLDNVLFLNIKDYAQLVFDVTDYKGLSSQSGFRVSLQNMKLTSKPKPTPVIGDNVQIKYNDVTTISYVEEGWAGKKTAVNAGFAIVVVILIICIVVFIYMFLTNFKRIKA
jgi:hypothetical protein